jgi:WD repeat-containing protein 48
VVGKSSSTDPAVRNVSLMRIESSDGDVADHPQQSSSTYSVFDFPTDSPPSIITEGAHSGPWRKKCVNLDGTEDDRDLPWWCIECVVNSRYPKENTK